MSGEVGHGEGRLVDLQRNGSQYGASGLGGSRSRRRALRASSSSLLGDLGGSGSISIWSGMFSLCHCLGNRLGFYAVVTRGTRITTPVGHEAFDGRIVLTLLFEPEPKRSSSGLSLGVRVGYKL